MLSITSIIFLLIIIITKKSDGSLNILDKIIVMSVFFVCCLFGLSLAIYPGWTKRLIKIKKYHKDKGKDQYKIRFLGHHPNCENFRSHILKTSKKTYCAGCLGLIIGFLSSVFLMTLYLMMEASFSPAAKYMMIFIGILFVLIGLVEYFTISNTILHIILNIIFVIALLLIIVGILEITQNKIYGFISIMISFIFIETRIHLSHWKHARICNDCINDCKIYI